MILSIVIVNYNVKYFLRQCLTSVFESRVDLEGGDRLELDVWVVDNDSVDDSLAMVRAEFPQVHVIENHQNVGFARANNQALTQCRAAMQGGLLLLLNPDTVVQPDTFAVCANFMRQQPQCGGLTVKLIDGRGHFLPESKRGFPTPEASFYKIVGLARLFPRSRRFAAYYMGHVDEDSVAEIEIMCGAFLMLRSEAYHRIGGLDESYFMYGEDIDFSWRIRQAGWQNWYLPTTRIIHYKGESTRKSSASYVYNFYNAMSIFVQKYFVGRGARFVQGLLKCAIWGRAALAWLRRMLERVLVPVADFVLAYAGFALLLPLWEMLKGVPHGYYPPQYLSLVVPLYILFLMASSWFSGGYDRPVRISRIVRGMAMGLLLLLAFYSLLDESQRYSRMLLLLGSAWTLVATLLVRVLMSVVGLKGYALRARKRGSTLLVGSAAETQRIAQLLTDLRHAPTPIECTAVSDADHLRDIIRISRAEEVIFCSRDVNLARIITLMAQLRTTGVDYRIAPEGADYIIGSENILSTDELSLYDLNTISSDTSRRRKRLFDVGTSCCLLLLGGIVCWLQESPARYWKHCWQVLIGKLTWVGYTGHAGVFAPSALYPQATPEQCQHLLVRYMRHYSLATDWTILCRHWRQL